MAQNGSCGNTILSDQATATSTADSCARSKRAVMDRKRRYRECELNSLNTQSNVGKTSPFEFPFPLQCQFFDLQTASVVLLPSIVLLLLVVPLDSSSPLHPSDVAPFDTPVGLSKVAIVPSTYHIHPRRRHHHHPHLRPANTNPPLILKGRIGRM